MSVPESVYITLYNMTRDPAVCGKIIADDHVDKPDYYCHNGTKNYDRTYNSTTFKGTFRGPIDLIQPTIVIERGNSGVVGSEGTGFSSADINKYNYFYITHDDEYTYTDSEGHTQTHHQHSPGVKRYYFMTGCVVEPNGLMVISGMEDVLETYKYSIRNLNCFVERCERPNFIDKEIPDTLLYNKPEIFINTKEPFAQVGWKSFEQYVYDWANTPVGQTHDNTLHCLIKFQQGVSFNLSDGPTYRVPVAPIQAIMCDMKWLTEFINKLSDIGSALTDYFLHWRDCVKSIEYFPDGIDSSYTIGEPTVNIIRMQNQQVEVNTFTGKAYLMTANLFSTDNFTKVSNWEIDLHNNTDYTNSAAYKTYKVRFLPWGEVNIPSDELIGKTTLVLKCEHSLVNGEARLFYGTKVQSSDSVKYQLLGSTKLNYQIPFRIEGNWTGTAIQVIKAAATIAGNRAIASAQSQAQNIANEKAKSASLRFAQQEGEFAKEKELANFYSAPDYSVLKKTFPEEAGNFKRMVESAGLEAANRQNYLNYMKYDANPANSTSQTLIAQQQLSAITGLICDLPTDTIHGNFEPVIVDKKPILLIFTHEIVELPTHLVGKPCMKTVYLFNCEDNSSSNKGYFVKVLYYNWDNFGSTAPQEPTPIPYELEQIGSIITTGFWLRKIPDYN